ncbi:isochorismate synthase [Goodfellowiella coeruleoviolacea]|uniref:isochorismate synthase n=1 Tax=Goodfellowiella coeruleoviolacea TaxID=334858 RepID=A0AAE3KGA4_9PSEU|nr:chorismate-binding protein [Goodfellowiella coeruleoviolacea]MCP2165935.1 isochorismate synthase [Goodfellowiella coeruleoviolacea]
MATTIPAVQLSVRTRPVRVNHLLDQLPAPDGALAWVREGDGLVGWGELARFEISGPDRFAEAERWWREFVADLDVRDDVGLPGTGPVAFVSMSFADGPSPSVLVVPRVVVGRRGGTCWITELGGALEPTTPLPVRRPVDVRYTDGELSVSGYRAAVRTAVRRMRAGELAKIVLAHDLVATAAEPIDPRFLLSGLAAKYPSCWAYAVDGLVGATPELLLRKTGATVTSRLLAGTIWPGSAGEADHELAATLLGSAKDQREHAYAIGSLADALRPFCSTLSVPAQPGVLRLPNVSHLVSDVSGRLADDFSLFQLAEAVHPTAAVGGTPTNVAVPLISELEGMDRGRYAGPVGWIGGDGDGEFGVALRCAQVTGPVARLFAGCGVVADSDPDREVREAEAKLVPIRQALEGADRA